MCYLVQSKRTVNSAGIVRFVRDKSSEKHEEDFVNEKYFKIKKIYYVKARFLNACDNKTRKIIIQLLPRNYQVELITQFKEVLH